MFAILEHLQYMTREGNDRLATTWFLRRLTDKSIFNIPDKKRNAPLRTVQISGRSQVIDQFSFYQCKGMSCTVASYVPLQFGVEVVLKKIGHEQSGGQIVKSQEISVFILLSCWISASNWNHLSRPNCTQTLILCQFYL